MAETLGTKDVLEQVDARLGNVEQDIRELCSEMNSRFDRVYQEISGLRAEVKAEIGGLRTEVKTEIRDLRAGMNSHFSWLYGLMVAVLLGVAGLWFK